MKDEKPRSRFVLCIRNDGADDLEPRKVYQVLPDRVAAREGYARVIDESGEDYLYPAEYFVPVRLPVAVSRELASPSTSARQAAESGAQLNKLAELVEQGKTSAALSQAVLRQKRIENCVIEHRRAGTPVGLIDTYDDLTNDEKADLLDSLFLRIKGRKPKVNKYRGQKAAT